MWTKTDDEVKADYYQSLNTKDIGSNLLKKKEIVRRLKLKSGRTAKIWSMPKKQLTAIIFKTNI
jgi:hypothetical protein